MTNGERILRRRFLPDGREERLTVSEGRPRLHRLFRTDAPPESVRLWFEALSGVRLPSVHAPDRIEEAGAGVWDVSMEAEGFDPDDHPDPLSPASAGLLHSLHESGLLHLDMAADPFRMSPDGPVLLVWGDAALQPGLPDHAPETLAGGFPSRLSDLYQLGLLAARRPGGGGTGGFSSPLPSRRAAAAARAGLPWGQCALPQAAAKLPRPGLTVLRGGGWEERDRVVDEWLGLAFQRGWPARVVRCSPDECWRPLPDRAAGGPRVTGASDLLAATLPGGSGVNRLLVVDGWEFASRDLREIVSDLANGMPSRLCLVVSSGGEAPASRTSVQTVELEGEATIAGDAPFRPGAGGIPGPAWFGVRLRRGLGAIPPPPPLDAHSALEEGAWREMVAAWDSGTLDSGAAAAVARSLLELGRWERALETAPESSLETRARALSALGRHSEAEKLLEGGRGAWSHETGMLLSDILLMQGRLARALETIEPFDDTEAVTRRARILDLRGNPAAALSIVERALEQPGGPRERISLLVMASTLRMRLGFYEEAALAAGEAVAVAVESAEPVLLAESLQERGRVREVKGEWRGALEDYRASSLYYDETGRRDPRPPGVDRFVLATRMGLLEEASRCRDALTETLQHGASGGPTVRQTLDMIDACAGVILRKGPAAIPAAERGAALAAELGMPLRQGLCLLYLGQLLAGEGEEKEALAALEHARGIAGILGDRHLGLLSDLAMAEARLGSAIEGLEASALELGLVSESLEAAAVAGPPGRFESALQGLIDLPSPIRACVLGAARAEEVDGRLLEALCGTRAEMLKRMDARDSGRFAAATEALARRLSSRSAPDGHPDGRMLDSFTSWLGACLQGKAGVQDLAEALSLDSAGLSPESGEMIASAPVALYARGGDMSAARLLGPIAAQAVASAPHEPDGGTCVVEDPFPEMVGVSAAMTDLKESMQRIAPLSVPVLVTGETGTGKELVARGIHRASGRTGPFVPLDCGAVPESLMESELFGARRGAYTDSREDRRGLLASARGGTLFLDEIGNLGQSLQAKLLRVLETGSYRRLGDTEEMEADFRVIAATNADPGAMVVEGAFRSDLYYRLAVAVLEIPPLRERPEDIPALAAGFMRLSGGGGPGRLTRGALSRLSSHSWPGNVRELRNVIQRAVITCRGETIRESDIAFANQGPHPGMIEPVTIEDAVANHVGSVWQRTGGSMSKAREILGCDPKTLRKYLSIYRARLERKGEPSR